MSCFKFESEFKIVSEAVGRFYDEYDEIQNQPGVHILIHKARFVFVTYYQLIDKCMRRAKRLKPEKKEECLAYLKYIRKTDADMNLHYTGIKTVALDVSHLLWDIASCSAEISDIQLRSGVSNSKNRRWVRRHWDKVVSDIKSGLEAIERYKKEYFNFEEEIRALKQVAEDRKAELKEDMDRLYGLSKL